MWKTLFILPAGALLLSGCNTIKMGDLTPAQTAALTCLAAQSGAAIAASLKPSSAAVVAANGQVLCTTATGVAAIISAK